ncbi:NAD-dependent epimerase [Schlegelella sp. S2-27]|uniref:NAD-dependent epimerase n=1 Tax=Caldimonas mangrovi TaxID=2944811 RepID=A0ABT0YL40_9BURK|nr:NAD-dependent epimerase [Caldimonas mangrovi]MCM5679452.1 NAD-dependent epimerase [Caldimonas mangrovi]
MKILVTGAAGFIGMHVCQRLLARGDEVTGVDDLNDYYSPQLKADRLAQLQPQPGFRFQRLDVADTKAMQALFAEGGFEKVVHLAAQAGVRHSIHHPMAYGHSNLVGYLNVLEACRHATVQHLVYASSSSVYGGNTKMPFSEDDPVDRPVSLYAATKRANELMTHSYSHLYGLHATGLRFFTVYGPWGRPDMAYFSFTKAVLEDRPIDVFNHGRMARDFTYIDDVVEGIVRVLDRTPDAGEGPPCRVLNIGNHQPEQLLDFIACIESATGRRARLNLLPMQDGDVPATYADVERLERWVGFRPTTRLQDGIRRFVDWYVGYYGAPAA